MLNEMDEIIRRKHQIPNKRKKINCINGDDVIPKEKHIKDNSITKFIDKSDNEISKWLNESKSTSKNASNQDLQTTADICSSVSWYKHYGLDLSFSSINLELINWKTIKAENLNLDYTILFPRKIADTLVKVLEDELVYFTGDLARVKVFGKWHNLPRKQVTFGDPGLTYKYSGIETPACPWPIPLKAVRELLQQVTGHYYNFVLVNRYKDGSDKIGEHKDDEKELDPNIPIASISLGQPRDFYFRHQDAKGATKKNIDKVQLVLEHGSLLLMKNPTNKFWYHALPPRKTSHGVRINLTFRKITVRK